MLGPLSSGQISIGPHALMLDKYRYKMYKFGAWGPVVECFELKGPSLP